MHFQFQQTEQNSLFRITDEVQNYLSSNDKREELINIIWNRQNEPIKFLIDDLPFSLSPNQITTSTYLQQVTFKEQISNPTLFSFNRGFYCIQDHDSEVSCNGIIFFGTQELPIITLAEEDRESFDMLYQVFIEEFKTQDNIQGEMLRMLLKRLIIKCTRLAKEQLITKELNNNQIDIVRKFNVLVDTHFRSKRHVSDYADLLNKSPKTLANLFATYNQKSPLQIIQERMILEARRLLIYSDMSTKEIAYKLGFDEVTTFNKIFKRITKTSPGDFKKSLLTSTLGRMDK